MGRISHTSISIPQTYIQYILLHGAYGLFLQKKLFVTLMKGAHGAYE